MPPGASNFTQDPPFRSVGGRSWAPARKSLQQIAKSDTLGSHFREEVGRFQVCKNSRGGAQKFCERALVYPRVVDWWPSSNLRSVDGPSEKLAVGLRFLSPKTLWRGV